MNSWLIFAFLSAVFAAATAILAKIGVRDVNANLATAIRTIIIVIFAWGVTLFDGSFKTLGHVSRYTLLFLVLSAIATGLSWLFYFRALQLGEASRVAPIDKLSLALTIVFAGLFLGEKITFVVAAGAALMTLGAVLIAFAK